MVTKVKYVCDSCIEAAQEEAFGEDDTEVLRMLCLEMGADIADHDCDGEGCKCACQTERRW